MAKLSLLGMYNYYPQLFKNFHIPEKISLDILKDMLIMETSDMEVLYSNPVVLSQFIGSWSANRLPIWEKMIKTTEYEYNPISNYDRKEEYTDSKKRDYSGTENNVGRTSTDFYSHDNKQNSTSSGTDTTKNRGYNSDTLLAVEQIEHTNTNDITATRQDETDSSTTTNATNSGNENETLTHTAYIHGNIGVTTTQEMIEAERNVVNFSVYDIIVSEFMERFIILVY